MTDPPAVKSRFSISLSGRLAQFNITLLLIGVLIVCLFSLLLKVDNHVLSYVGIGLLLVIVSGFAIFAIWFYSRQEIRPEDGKPSKLQIQTPQGAKMTIENPPDRIFTEEYCRVLVRGLLVGYDEKLCADGKVIGPASNEQYEMYDEARKREFQEMHRAQIKGKRREIEHLLSEGDSKPEDQLPGSGSGVKNPTTGDGGQGPVT
jgi:hypothetical protein